MTVPAKDNPRSTKHAEAWGPKLRVTINHPQTLDIPRPLTATLDKPSVLDITLLKKLDMTNFTKKGLLTVMNLCGLSVVKLNSEKAKRGKPKKRKDVKVKKEIESSWAEDSSSSELKSDRSERVGVKLATVKTGRYVTNKLCTRIVSHAIDEVFGGPVPSLVAPEPCRTCGRSNQPERFHSHPRGMPLKPTATARKLTTMPGKSRSAGTNKETAVTVLQQPPTSGRPRTITCYLCSREFGTTSFPLHEPKCIQRWEHSNTLLAPHLRRALPERPKGQMSIEEWNEYAWKVSQMSLVPCQNCGRTFNPDRLDVHLRSCKPQVERTTPRASPTPSSPARPRTVICYICGREFGTKSIAIHEPQCLKKWRAATEQLPAGKRPPEPVKPGCYVCGLQVTGVARAKHEEECIARWRHDNSTLPEEQQQLEPVRPDFRFTASGEADNMGTFHSLWANHMDSLVACQTCGRKFFPDRIERHQECCNNHPIKTKTK